MDKLPKGWDIVSLSEVCTVLGGGTPKTSINDYWNGEIIWLSPTDLPEIGSISKISSSTKKITQLGLNKSSAKLLPKGSVVFSSRASIGKIGIAEIELTTNQGFTNFICSEKILNHYLCYVLKRSISEIASLSNSTTFAEVSKSSIKSFQIPLPPLPEQKRIVSKLDALFEHIDKSMALLEENITHTGSLMASALDEVFLEIDRKYWVELRTISDLITKGSSPNWQGVKYVDEPGVLFITSKNVGNHKLILGDKKTYLESKFNEIQPRSILQKDDILLNIVGASIGRTAKYDLEEVANINQAVCLIRLKKSLVNVNYALHFFNSTTCISYMFDKKVDNARANLSMGNIQKFLIPIPPLEQQNKISKKIRAILNNLELFQKEQQDKLNNLKALKESLLDKAFKGEI